MSNIDEKLASIPTSPLLAERMTKDQPSCENDPKIAGCSDDTISRQAAIDALHMHLMYRMGTDSNKKRLDEWINNLPSAQPKRKTGHKINQHQYPAKWVCSECGAKHFDFSDNFCSQCGADVRGEQDG